MFTYKLLNVKTSDKKGITVAIQSKNRMNNQDIQKIKNYVAVSMSVSYAIQNLDPCYQQVKITISNVVICFEACFILTWNSNYTAVTNADLISFIETQK